MILSQIDILDIIIRHQVYVEFFKNSQSEEHSEFLDWMVTYLTLYFSKKGITQFEEFNKGDIAKLVSDFSKRAGATFGARQASITAQIRKFFTADYSLLKSLFANMTPKKSTVPPSSKLWARVMRTASPGTGEEPKNLIKSFARSVVSTTTKTIKQAFAEKWSISEFLRMIVGSSPHNYRDGLMNRWRSQLGATIETFISSVSSFLNHTIGSIFFDEYQWISVLDSRTTEICRHRDGNVYRYGQGPIPPAHYRCRSSIIPIVERSLKVMPTFSSWVSRQPREVMDDILGVKLAQRTRNGASTVEDIGNVLRTRKLTLTQFGTKRNLILTKETGNS